VTANEKYLLHSPSLSGVCFGKFEVRLQVLTIFVIDHSFSQSLDLQTVNFKIAFHFQTIMTTVMISSLFIPYNHVLKFLS